MTVAPATGIANPNPRAVLPLVPCSSCGTSADPREPFCAHCGSRLALTRARGVASLAATRSLQAGILVFLTNALVGATSFGVVYLLSDAQRLTEAAVGLETMRWLLVVALASLAIRLGFRGVRETRDGVLRGRYRAIAGIALAALVAVLATFSCVATAALLLLP